MNTRRGILRVQTRREQKKPFRPGPRLRSSSSFRPAACPQTDPRRRKSSAAFDSESQRIVSIRQACLRSRSRHGWRGNPAAGSRAIVTESSSARRSEGTTCSLSAPASCEEWNTSTAGLTLSPHNVFLNQVRTLYKAVATVL